MKVRVDLETCEANGLCVKLCPDVFQLDENDVLHIKTAEIASEHEERVRRAVAKCPKQALHLES